MPQSPPTRLEKTFERLKAEKRSAFVTFVTAGDPTIETSLELVQRLPSAGADIIELGMPFTDPMADGPAIQRSSQRALAHGMSLKGTLELVRKFREQNDDTPVILMGYYNPIYQYGVSAFIRDALSAGVDGTIVVDLPPEADGEMCIPALQAGLHFIRLATPTTDDVRLPTVLTNTSGFVYYVSITGITGTASINPDRVRDAVARIKAHTALPVAVGFGIKTPEDVRNVASMADGVVVGSAIVNHIQNSLDDAGEPLPNLVDNVTDFVKSLSQGVQTAQ